MADLAGGNRQQHFHPPQRPAKRRDRDPGRDRAGTFHFRRADPRPKTGESGRFGFHGGDPAHRMRAVSTEITPETGAGGFILPNDRIDVILSRHDAKNPDHPNSADNVRSETVLTNIRVLAIDQAPKEKDGQNNVVGRTVTLELKPDQAETLARARQSGTLSLALRSIADANRVESTAKSLLTEAAAASVSFATAYPPLPRRHRSDERTFDMRSRRHYPTMRALMVRALSFTAVAALTLNPVLTPVMAADPQTTGSVKGSGQSRFLALGIGKSIVVDLPRDVKDVLVADPKIANAVIRSEQRALHHRLGRRSDQYRVLRWERPADRRLRHRRQTRSQRCAHRAAAVNAGRQYPDRRRRRQCAADRLGWPRQSRRNRLATSPPGSPAAPTRSSIRSWYAVRTR